MTQISVIVPVYKTEKYLKRCVDSLLMQTFTDFELILIDDGSPDSCGLICDEYAKKDIHVKVIHQKNSGVSSARNVGLGVAKGKYICFVDSDDYVEPDYLQLINETLENEGTQMVYFGINRIATNTNKMVSRSIPDLPNNETEAAIKLTEADLFGYTCVKAISREIIGETRFDITLDLFEDEVFTCEIIQKKPCISRISKAIYNQRVLPDSLSKKTYRDYYRLCESVYIAWKRLLYSAQVEKDSILLEKANHMTNVCKYYYLEKKVPPIEFACGLAQCSFFKESKINDSLIYAIKGGYIINCLIQRIIYRTKMYIRELIER